MSNKSLGNPAAILLASQLAQSKGQGGSSGAALPVVLDSQSTRFIQYAKIGLGLSALGLVGFLVGRKILRGFWFRKSVDQIDDKQKGAYYAQRLYNGLYPDTPFGFGTDEVFIRDTVLQVPHRRMWKFVKDAYADLLNKHGKAGELMNDLRRDLSPYELTEILAIIDSMPKNQREADRADPFEIRQKDLENWAIRINAGAEYQNLWFFGGTDETAIYKVLEEVPSLEAVCLLNSEYRKHNSERLSLIEELQDELDQQELLKVYEILINKPDATANKIQRLYQSGCQ